MLRFPFIQLEETAMHNSTRPAEVFYTTHSEDHEGYRIHWATTHSTSEPGKYLGHFRALKDGEETIGASLGKPLATEADAKNEAIRFAKAAIDEKLGANG
jgi:hypothetical protein